MEVMALFLKPMIVTNNLCGSYKPQWYNYYSFLLLYKTYKSF